MASISFNCPQCGTNISVDEKSSEMNIPCPFCSAQIEITSVKSTHTGEKSGVKWEVFKEQTLATTIKSSHCSESLDETGAPRLMSQMPRKRPLTASIAFGRETQPNAPKSKTFQVQGCLPVLAICIGAFISMCSTMFTDNTTSTIGPVLILAGIAWAVIAPRMSAWFERGSMNCKQAPPAYPGSASAAEAKRMAGANIKIDKETKNII